MGESGETNTEQQVFLEVYQDALREIADTAYEQLKSDGALNFVHWNGRRTIAHDEIPQAVRTLLNIQEGSEQYSLLVLANTIRNDSERNLSAHMGPFDCVAAVYMRPIGSNGEPASVIIPEPDLYVASPSSLYRPRVLEPDDVEVVSSWIQTMVLGTEDSYIIHSLAEFDPPDQRVWPYVQNVITALCDRVQVEKTLAQIGDVKFMASYLYSLAEPNTAYLSIDMREDSRHESLGITLDLESRRVIKVQHFAGAKPDLVSPDVMQAVIDQQEKGRLIGEQAEKELDKVFEALDIEENLGISQPTPETIERFAGWLRQL